MLRGRTRRRRNRLIEVRLRDADGSDLYFAYRAPIAETTGFMDGKEAQVAAIPTSTQPQITGVASVYVESGEAKFHVTKAHKRTMELTQALRGRGISV